MTKEVDNNGFWRVRDNPLSKEGVFPYLGKQISADLEPNKIYKVYRPMSEISAQETIESFDGIPLIDEHEMIGEGWTDYDDRPAGGVVYHTYAKDGKLFGDIRIFSEKLKDEIKNGKKELSMGYSCRYEPAQGVFDGKYYDFIQRDLRGNHVALVNRGRMGSDVRVYDQKITFDTLEGLVFDYRDDQDRGSDGRWIKEGSSEPINNTSLGEHKIELSGNELGEYADIKELRNKAKEYYREHYQGKTIEREGLGIVNFSGKGIRETISGGAQEDKIKLVPAIGDIIRYGKIGKEEPLKHPRNDDIVAFIPVTSKVSLNDKSLNVGVLIGKDSNGKLYYDMFIKKQPGGSVTLSEVGLDSQAYTAVNGQDERVFEGSQHAAPATNQGDTGVFNADKSAYNYNITQDFNDVNIYFGEDDMDVQNQDEIPSLDGSPKESGVDCSLNQQGNDSMEKGKATDEEAKEDKSEDEAKTCKDCKAKDEKSEVAEKTADGEAPTEEKKDKEKDKDTKAEDAKPALDALPEILARLESIENSLKGRNENKSDVIFGLDETPVKSNEMDKGLMKYLGE